MHSTQLTAFVLSRCEHPRNRPGGGIAGLAGQGIGPKIVPRYQRDPDSYAYFNGSWEALLLAEAL